MAVSVEEILGAAKVLDDLALEDAYKELDEPTHWMAAAQQLGKLAEKRTPKPFKPRVYVDYDEIDTAVFVEKTDGKFVSVYVGSAYNGDGRAGAGYVDNLGDARGNLVFGG